MDKKVNIISGVIMSALMAIALSGFFTLTKMGFVPGWGLAWAKGFMSAWPLALLLSMVIAKPVRSLAMRLAGQ
ncbi:MAG: DUF2798 domain-containing protein [Reinekea sp.]|jgi:hypothetical protein|nr:DUF2798 domain-containing protein [Reinekea sp.]MDX1472618.1 DUF2798 domain-containing protein [Reinekea sp.]